MQPDETLAESLFHAALACPSEDERRALLEQAAPGDTALRRRVLGLLAAHAKANRFLSGSSAPEVRDEEADGWIGRYRLVEPLGEGGFGSVWLAEQRVPFVRQVALKVIKLGMDTRAVIARFEAERQALALMDHPNIARVLDAGATDGGRPYFVMEFVKGTSIVEFCDAGKLSIRDRLSMFLAVCRAIEHAHQKGIIHRDIKPSNVLVTLHDGVPTPKVIDFGIAKAMQSELTTRTLFTEHHQLVGTPAYMSPEQARIGGLDVDTRSDVYSLGVLLYELLTGTTPHDARGLLESGYAEWVRAVREDEPPRPSTRIAALGATGTTTAAQRGVPFRRLWQMLRGDLDWIVMRCLEKDRDRRYPTAGALALDVAAHLDHRPVGAGPPGRAYRFFKFVRRNRAAVLAFAAVIAALVLGIVGTTIGLFAAQRESRRAVDLATAAENSARDAHDSTIRAEQEAARARAAESTAVDRARELGEVVQFQSRQMAGIDVAAMGERLHGGLLEEVRRSARSSGESEAEVDRRIARFEGELSRLNLTNLAWQTLDETIFERALAAANDSFLDQPRVRAQILQSLAVTMAELGLLEHAREPQRIALEIRRAMFGEMNVETLESLESTGQLEGKLGHFAEAEATMRNVLDARRRLQGDDSEAVGVTAQNLGAVLMQENCPDDAEPYFREAIAHYASIRPRQEWTALDSMNDLCVVWQAQGRAAEVEPLLRIVVDESTRLRGWKHPATLSSLDTLGTVLKDLDRLDEAEAITLAALAGRSRTLGDDHPDTVVSLNNAGAVFLGQSKFDDAEYMFREALSAGRRRLGEAHPYTLGTSGNLCALLHMTGRDEEALPLLRDQLDVCRRVLGEQDETTIAAGNSYGQTLSSLGRSEEAVPVLRGALEACRATFGDQHPSTLLVGSNCGLALWSSGELEEAYTVLDRVLAGRRVLFGSESLEVSNTLIVLGRIRLKQQRYVEAEALLRECLAIPVGPRTPSWGRPLVAGLLGASLSGQGRHDEADAYLVEGYETFDPPPARQEWKRDALERLIEHYRAWGRAERAAHYEGLRAVDPVDAHPVR